LVIMRFQIPQRPSRIHNKIFICCVLKLEEATTV
jgi:hypothetical protein